MTFMNIEPKVIFNKVFYDYILSIWNHYVAGKYSGFNVWYAKRKVQYWEGPLVCANM